MNRNVLTMKNLLVLALALFTSVTFVNSQQLIADPGFENWNGTSGNYMGPLFDWYENTALPWPASNMGSPDHHHQANPNGSNLTSADPTCTLTGSNFSGCGGVFAGQGCLGIWTETNASFDGTREVAGTQLTSPMIVGECYKVSFWVQAKTNSSGYYRHISGQGLMFSMTQYPSYDPSTVDYNTLSNSYVATDSIIADTIWHYIEMTFTADQAYTHAFVGILGNWADINYQFGTTWGNAVGPYYWFDEVKVEQMASCCETNFDSQGTTDASCGMSDGSMTVVPTGAGPYNYQLFSYPGNTLVSSNSTGDFQGIPAGDYYVTIFDAHCNFNSDTLTVGQLGTPTYTLNGTDPTTCGGADGTIIIGSLVNGTNYDISYVDPSGTPVGPINFTADATGIYTITGLIQGNYTDIEVEFNGCGANLGNYELFDPTGVTLNVSLNPIAQCGDIPEIVLSGLVPGETYDWSFDTGYSGTGDVANAAGEIVITVAVGSYDNFSATLVSSGCTAINNTTIDVLDVTPVDATVTPTSAANCIDDGNISFQGLEPGLTFNIYWPGGDTLLAVSSGSGVINLPFPVGTWGQFVVENATTLCTDTLAPVNIVNPIDPNDSIQTIYGIDESCFGANDGEVFIFDFGFLIYDIYIDSVLMTPANLVNLAPGTYEIVKHNTVTGCYVVYNITVNPGPLCCNIGLMANTDVQPTCGGADGQVTLTDTSALGSTQYSVDGGALQSSPVFTGLTGGVHQFIVVDSAGCSDTLDYDVVPLGAPAAPVVGTDATYCDGDVIADLTAAIGSGGTITWYDDVALTNNVGTGTTFTPPSTIGAITYYATETVTGCESSANSATVTINATPAAPTAGTDAIYCSGDPMVDLTTGATSPNWYDDAGLTNNIGTGTTLTPGTTIGTTIYFVTETQNGCESVASQVSITINDLPTITNEASTNITDCLNPDGSITITSNGTSFELFDAANNSITTNATGSFTGLNAGDYYVVVTLNGCTTTSSTFTISNAAAPAAPVAGTDATYCDGDAIADLTATASAGGTLAWYDDAGLTNQVGTGSPFTPASTLGTTTYYVTETASNCESPASTVVVTINAVPNAPTAGTDATYCLGDAMADLTTSATSPNWYDDAGLTNNIGTGTTLTPSSTIGTTIYYVTETTNGCSSPAATVTVTVNDVPTITAEAATDVTSCVAVNGTVTITANGTSYELFDAANNSIAINATGSFSGLDVGDYYVVVSNGVCTTTSATLTITDQTLPSSSTINAQACSGTSYTFADGSSQTITSNTSYVSTLVNSIGCDSLVTENVTVVQPTTTVIDTTICEGTDYTSVGDAANFVNVLNDFQHTSVLTGASGCDSTIIENITVIPVPTIDLGPDFNGCDGETVTIDATISSGTILWSTGETTNSITVTLSSDTMYYATVTDNCGVVTDTVNIDVFGAPIVDAGPDITIPLGSTAQLEVTSATSPISYQWMPSNFLDCVNCDSPISSPTDDMTYVVSGTDENGCVGYDTVNIVIDGELTVYIPNIFSPNNDGENDFFQVYGPQWDQYKMQIFDRWGGIIFESEDPNVNWDGKHYKNGEEVPQAVFVYKFWGKSLVGIIVERAGTVMLAR